jgi:FkbM family methyltransferase
MSLTELRDAYRSGALTKAAYADKMHGQHALLFAYSAFLRGTDIARIEITDEGVILTFRDTGIRMLCSARDKRVTPIEILNFGHGEEDELGMVLRIIPPGGTVLDIGANVGWYSLNIAKTVPGVRVLAFEPIPDTFQNLVANIRLNGVTNVEACNFGLSDKAEEKVFYFCEDFSGSASAANIGERADAREVRCRVVRLDDFMDGRPEKVDFIKCDVEGAELMVFRGGQRFLSSQKPAILVEMLRKWSAKFNYHPNDIIALLGGIGYGCYEIDGKKLKPLPRMDDQTVATNFVFLHAERHRQLVRDLVV